MRHPLAALGPLVFEHAADALFVFDPECARLVDANAAAVALAGCGRDLLLQQRPDTLFRLDSGEALPAGVFRTALTSGHPYTGRWQLHRRPDGVWIPVQAHIVGLRCDPDPCALLTLHDLRAQQETEALLRA